MGSELAFLQTNQRLAAYSHLLGLYQTDAPSSNEDMRNHLSALPESIRQKIFWHVYDLSGRPQEANYGEVHVFDSQPKLQQAIQRVASEAFDALDVSGKNAVEGRICRRSGAENTVEVLLSGLHESQLLKTLDEWVNEAPSNERRGREGARHWIIQYINHFSSPSSSSHDKENLDLRFLGLTSLPPIFDQEPFASELKRLILNTNEFNTFPKEIFQLRALTNLSYTSNRLVALPPEIGQLSKLEVLNLAKNNLTTLPAEISQLSKLEFLDLEDNNLTTLPAEICTLTSLKSLDLSTNQLANLPQEFGQLGALESVILSRNHLVHLPPQIGQLGALRSLSLSENQLTDLPPQIGQLRALRSLYLPRNQLTGLPPQIGQLDSLSILELSFNRLSNLPAEIGQLGALRQLNLHGNTSLAGLPNQVFDLSPGCSVNVTSTGLSRAVIDRLREICTARGYRGPQLSISMERNERAAPNETLPLATLISQLFTTANIPAKELHNLSSLPEDQERTLRSWLSRLSDTADYKKKGQFQENFAKRIVGYLTQAENDPQFREVFFNIIDGASETCGDRVALSILYLDIADQLAKIDRKEISRLRSFLLETVWPIEILEKMARDKIPTLRFFDEIEVYLGYPIQLREALGLKIGVEDMLYFRCSALTPKDLKEAEDVVRSMQADDQKVLDFLFGRKEWMEALQATYPEKSKEIEDEIDAEMETCQTAEDYKSLDAERKEKWMPLTAWSLAGA